MRCKTQITKFNKNNGGNKIKDQIEKANPGRGANTGGETSEYSEESNKENKNNAFMDFQREREKHQCEGETWIHCLPHAPYWRLRQQPGHVPRLISN